MAPAQYRVHSWQSFENGTLPLEVSLGHNANTSNVKVVDLAGFAENNRSIQSGKAKTEVGRFGLHFQPEAENAPHLSAFSPTSLDRSRLGSNGRALYQADFFIPAEGEPVPNAALLAAVPKDDGSLSYKFYRFGILKGGDSVFFSFSNDEPQPVLYFSQELSELNLTRPGWHRFQIVFIGQNQIYCAIDGVPTGFSPIQESTLQQLSAGIMVTDDGMGSTALADNLSIQWTNSQSELPISPWRYEEQIKTADSDSLFEQGMQWLSEPSEAWDVSKSTGKPILTMFYAPKAAPYNYLKSLSPNSEAQRSLMDNYVLLKIDANQLSGGGIAQKFSIFRVPTLLIMGSDGQERDKLIVENNKTEWQEISSFLEQGSGG